MASLTVNLPRVRNSTKSYQYADLHLDLSLQFTTNNQLFKQAERKDFKVDYDINAVSSAIINLLTTSPGEKILNPAFGIDLRTFLFEPVNVLIGKKIEEIISANIILFEPRLSLQMIKVIPNKEEQQYDIDIVYSVPTLSDKQLVLNGRLNNDGYVFR